MHSPHSPHSFRHSRLFVVLPVLLLLYVLLIFPTPALARAGVRSSGHAARRSSATVTYGNYAGYVTTGGHFWEVQGSWHLPYTYTSTVKPAETYVSLRMDNNTAPYSSASVDTYVQVSSTGVVTYTLEARAVDASGNSYHHVFATYNGSHYADWIQGVVQLQGTSLNLSLTDLTVNPAGRDTITPNRVFPGSFDTTSAVVQNPVHTAQLADFSFIQFQTCIVSDTVIGSQPIGKWPENAETMKINGHTLATPAAIDPNQYDFKVNWNASQ